MCENLYVQKRWKHNNTPPKPKQNRQTPDFFLIFFLMQKSEPALKPLFHEDKRSRTQRVFKSLQGIEWEWKLWSGQRSHQT